MNGNGEFCAQEKRKNMQNSVVQKNDAYNDVLQKYLEKIDEQS